MSIRKIVKYPKQERALRTLSEPITVIDREVRLLAQDLHDTSLANPAVGLAAPQIGVNLDAIVLRLGQKKTEDRELGQPIVIINPEIIKEGPSVREYDACLSIPDLYAYTFRPGNLTIKGLDLNNEPIKLNLSGLDATVAHHEVDHLKGILFVDHIKNLKKDLYVILRYDSDNSFLVPYIEYLQITGSEYMIPFVKMESFRFSPEFYPIINPENKKKVLEMMMPDD